jgi:peptide/nickel transport system ATP-binding protein
MSAAPLLEVDRLTLRFPGQANAAVEDVSFTIASGETLGLVGESGSGKSLTALLIVGLAPAVKAANAPCIYWHGEKLDGERLARIRGRRIGMVFQEPAGCLNPLMTVGRQVAEVAGRGTSVATLFTEVELHPSLADRYPHELSGGQQQRAMLAIALAGNPELLIADEPTTALDVTVQTQIVALLQRLKAQRGMALLFISHDLGLIGTLADRVVVMRHGRVVETATTTALFTRPEQAYTKALLAARPGSGAQPERLPTLDDAAAGRGTVPTLPRPPIGGPVLQIDGLSVNYPPRHWWGKPARAVDAVSLDLRAGETLGLVGESGCGKSTIAKAVIGLVRPAGGTIALFGQRLPERRQPGHARCQIAFQDSGGSLNPRLTVAAIISEPLRLRGIRAGAALQPRLERLLAEVRLDTALLRRYPQELSGGQRQRVNIARALALDPDVLICDEIVSALDVTVQALVLNLLKDIQARRGLTLLFISHDLAVVRFMSDRVAVMQQGRIIEVGPVNAVLDQPQQTYTRRLTASHTALASAAV